MFFLRNKGYTEVEVHSDGVHIFYHDLPAEGNDAVDQTQKIMALLEDPEKRRAMVEYGFHVISNEFQDVEYQIEFINYDVPFMVKGYCGAIAQIKLKVVIVFLYLKDRICLPIFQSFPAEKICYVPPGAYLESSSAELPKVDGHDGLVLLAFGMINRYKNIPVLIQIKSENGSTKL